MEATPTTTIATITATSTSSPPPYDAGGALDIPPSTTASTIEASIHGFDSNEKSISDNKLESDLEQQDKPSNHTPTGIRRFLLLLGLFLGCILAALDNTIVATALPQISSDFNAQSQMAWIATAYLLAYTAFQSLYGRFSDIFGLKTMYLGASVIFLIGSIGCGAASSMIMLIIFRAVQGIGGAGLLSIMMIMVSVMFGDINERARYQTLGYLAFGISGICGPLLGGVFVEHSTWRWCFYMNIPIGVFAVLLVFKFYQIPFERTETLQKKLRRVDYFGVLITIGAVLCLLLPLNWGGTAYDWNSAVIISLFCIMGVLIIVLVFVEQRAAEPIIPMYLFLNREVALLVTVNFLTGLIFNGCGFYIPLYFQVVQGTSVTDSGLRLMPAVLGAVFSTGSSGFLLAKVKDYRRFITLGAATLTLSVGLFILLDEHTSLAKQLIFVLIMGLGQGFIYQNCVLACQDCTEAKDMAVATGFVVFINSIGNAVGVAVCASVINNSLTTNLAKLPESSQAVFRELNVIENINVIFTLPEELKAEVVHAYALAFRTLFTILTPMIGLGFVLSLFVRRRGSLARKE
ncbi:hypothetical protein KI688_005785 [Linnemannia hyalina]|uniref:Major facilitator superfamily (MFS) profile domain-containing protein n=1 Tax=Linnemannia hyalina TaxID=64524 RepID=A0A9P8BXP9_9FUNG|nr:hypothetical protein KI688_005785 [Linnemannia hyalina]